MMGRDQQLAQRLRTAGLHVEEIPGWQNRGGTNFDPRGCILHHTAGPRRGTAPSLNVCINGRHDVPGPLCNILIGRDGVCWVIAAGKANHAGRGGYRGMTSSSACYGIEVENTGYGSGPNAEPWTPHLLDTVARATAALPVQVDLVCQHKEWAPTRKVDMHTVTGDEMRARVAAHRNDPTPAKETPVNVLSLIVHHPTDGSVWHISGMWRKHLGNPDSINYAAFFGVPVVKADARMWAAVVDLTTPTA